VFNERNNAYHRSMCKHRRSEVRRNSARLLKEDADFVFRPRLELTCGNEYHRVRGSDSVSDDRTERLAGGSSEVPDRLRGSAIYKASWGDQQRVDRALHNP